MIAFGDDRFFMLFDLKTDPEEKKDLIQVERDRTARMLDQYRKLSEGIELREVTGYAALKGAPEGRKW